MSHYANFRNEVPSDWVGTVSITEHLGSDTILHVLVESVGIVKARVAEFGLRRGQKASLTPDPTKIHRFDARSEDDAVTSPRHTRHSSPAARA